MASPKGGPGGGRGVMRVTEIRTESALEALRPSWNGLLRDSGSSTIFLTWEWISAWWRCYGQTGELRVLAAFNESGILRGIAPLRVKTARQCGQTVPAVYFIGDCSNDSEYLDFIIARGEEER